MFKKVWPSFLIFVIINICLYLFILLFQNRVPFNQYNYVVHAHHYFQDPKIKGESFNFLRSLGQYDGQWYLKIANEGYPRNPTIADKNRKDIMDSLTYGFFPFYPLILSIFNTIFSNIEMTAFIIANLLLLANFFSLYFLVKEFFSEKIALKAIFLIFFYPFSIFYRSYFSEGIFLLLLIWFSYFLMKKKWLATAATLGLLIITRPTGLFLILLLGYYVDKEFSKKRINLKTLVSIIALISAPFLVWVFYNFQQTGNPLYFYTVRESWFETSTLFSTFLNNLLKIFSFFRLPFHFFLDSKLDLMAIIAFTFLLIKSKKLLTEEWWWISFLLLVAPLFVIDTMSSVRYQSVLFPLFVYLASSLKGITYYLVLVLFLVSLFMVSLYFVNWYWIG